jgi:hypothetical protein
MVRGGTVVQHVGVPSLQIREVGRAPVVATK